MRSHIVRSVSLVEVSVTGPNPYLPSVQHDAYDNHGHGRFSGVRVRQREPRNDFTGPRTVPDGGGGVLGAFRSTNIASSELSGATGQNGVLIFTGGRRS